ncbi:MAG: helix-turn-helix domain-containing protein [Mangrovibacterium sp.]
MEREKVRKGEKVTQEELAKRIGSSKSYISRIEKGVIDPKCVYILPDNRGFRVTD